MNHPWPSVPLGEVLKHRKEFITIDDSQEYKRCRIQLHAKGIVLRDIIEGARIKTKEQQVCRSGEFLVAEIDAKVGGFGIVPEHLDGAIVSSHYFLFEIDHGKLDKGFLDFYIRTPTFRDQVSARGTTNYAAIRPAQVLAYSIPPPPLPEQRRIVVKIEALAARIGEALRLRNQAAQEADAVFLAQVSAFFHLDDCWAKVEDAVAPQKGAVRSGPFGSQLHHDEFTTSGVMAVGTRDVQVNRLELRSGWFVSEEKFEGLRRYQVFPGDVLCTIVGASIGRFCVVPENVPLAFTTKHIQALTLHREIVDPWFVSYMLNFHQRCRESLFAQVEGSAQPSLNATKVLGTELPLPSLSEQRRVVSHLDDLHAQVITLKKLQSQTTAELDALLPAILDRAFKGEL
jgi:type I restriction enzyme, S subunit